MISTQELDESNKTRDRPRPQRIRGPCWSKRGDDSNGSSLRFCNEDNFRLSEARRLSSLGMVEGEVGLTEQVEVNETRQTLAVAQNGAYDFVWAG